jgi:hypothetical protein
VVAVELKTLTLGQPQRLVQVVLVAVETLEAVLAVELVTDQTELLILAAEAVRKNPLTLQLVGLVAVVPA